LTAKVNAKLDISAERTKLELARIGYSDIRQFYDENGFLIPVHQLSDDAAACLAGVEEEKLFDYRNGEKEHIGNLVKIKRHDKLKALEMLARIDGIFEKDNSQTKAETKVIPAEELEEIKALLRAPSSSKSVDKAA